MGRLRGRIKKAEREARGDLDSFLLLDGSRFWFDATEACEELFLHAYHLGLGRVEEPPELYRMLTRAQDPVAVLERLKPGSAQAFVDPSSLYDYDALVHERRLVPIVAPEPEDLSEGA
jgi:hypothetical protein